MARPKTFSNSDVIARATEVFADLGFNGASVDDLLNATSIQRGSLYKAFGSKRGLFISCLKSTLEQDLSFSEATLDLMIVAMKDLASKDAEVREICLNAISEAWDKSSIKPAEVFGARLISYLEEKNA